MEYALFIAILIAVIKLVGSLQAQKAVAVEHGFSSLRVLALQASVALYVLSAAGWFVPGLKVLSPVRFGFVLLIPGIVLGKAISSKLETAGNDRAEKAGRVASNALWLGVGLSVLMLGYTGIGMIMLSYHG